MTNSYQFQDDHLITKIPFISMNQMIFLKQLMNEARCFARLHHLDFYFSAPKDQQYFGGYEPQRRKDCGYSIFGFNRTSKKICMIVPQNTGISKQYYFETKTWTNKRKIAVPIEETDIEDHGDVIIHTAIECIRQHYNIKE